MTTKEALKIAITALQEKEPTEKTNKAIKQLQYFQKREIVTKWDKEKIIAALNNWKERHNKIPTVTNLVEPDMPGASIIQKHFNTSASALLHKLYPVNDDSERYKGRYGFESNDDWLNCFREQFLKHRDKKYFSSKTYNKFRDKGTPAWSTIAEHCGVMGWLELMRLANVKYVHRRLSEPTEIKVVDIKSPLLERYIAAVKKKEELYKEFLDRYGN